MVDYICDYMTNIKDKRVISDVEPGYLRPLLPDEAPLDGEPWDVIMKDVEDKIMPGVTHWNHPRFHAYFPSGNSYPSILGDMLSDAISCIGFSWAASPACTELETIVMDWYGQAIGLPQEFISTTKGARGGGVLQASASECILVCMLAARNKAIRYLKQRQGRRGKLQTNGYGGSRDKKANKMQEPTVQFELEDLDDLNEDETTHDSAYLPQLVAYCSRESHSCVEKAAMILLVKLKILDVDDEGSLRGETLQEAIRADTAKGLIPFFVSTTLGSTGCTSFDNLAEIGPVCRAQPTIWLHVDAAYAGNAFICPELRPLMHGIEHADSFNTNTNKWLLVNFDCSCLWVRDKFLLTQALVVDPLYLQHDNSQQAIDYRHWGIPLSRRFRSLKLWFVLRKYGIEGLRSYIRNHIKLAKKFEALVRKDSRFEVVNNVRLGLVCFRLDAPDTINRDLLAMINHSGKMHMIPSMVRGQYIIRFCVVAEKATEDDMLQAWIIIKQQADKIMPPDLPLSPAFTRPPLTKQKSLQMSFTRSVSREVYKRQLSKSQLSDGATPILIFDEDLLNTPRPNDDLLNDIMSTKNDDDYDRNDVSTET